MHSSKLHGLEELKPGETIGDINPAFANLKGEIRIGNFAKCCASCRKPFNAVRKKRKEIRLWPVDLGIPLAWAYPICGTCVAAYQRGGDDKEAVLAAVEAFHHGETPAQ
nr:hypothetical protein [Dechloromonas sp.]